FTLIFAAVVFPVGMFVLARFLAPQRVLVAGLTAFLTPMLALYTYPAMQLSSLALIVGMAMVPVSAVVVTKSIAIRSIPKVSAWLCSLLPSAVVLFAVITVHTSETTTLMLLVTALLVGHFWRSWRAVINALGPAVALLFIVLVLLLPTIGGVVSGAS